MSVRLRLQRRGSKHRPFYQVVAADSRMRRDGRFIEKLGYYNPNSEPSLINLKEDRLQYWYENGASVAGSVAALLKAKKLKLSRHKKKVADEQQGQDGAEAREGDQE